MINFSPAAQAVLDAFGNSLITEQYTTSGRIEFAIAAALRAAVDQVVPPEQEAPWGSVIQAHTAELRIRNELLDIVDELEAL